MRGTYIQSGSAEGGLLRKARGSDGAAALTPAGPAIPEPRTDHTHPNPTPTLGLSPYVTTRPKPTDHSTPCPWSSLTRMLGGCFSQDKGWGAGPPNSLDGRQEGPGPVRLKSRLVPS